jgi:uncharacterized protein YecE (DUF72 family)
MARAYVGTSGWVYKGWRAHLYADTPVKRWLEVASRTFDALEINGSFYTQISPATYERWYAETPPGFRFALKGHRFVTHYKRLRDCDSSIVLLRDQAQPLREKLGAIVWQLPAHIEADVPRLEAFCAALKRLWPARHAIEMRHRSWFTADVARVLAASGVASCLSDAPDFPMWREVTTDFVYIRLHGHTRKYASSYSERSLEAWADDTRRWVAEGRDVHVYFDNDAEGHAVRNALRLSELLDGSERRIHRLASSSRSASSESAHASPWRRPTAPSRSRASSEHRSTARKESRARPRGARAPARDRAGTSRR